MIRAYLKARLADHLARAARWLTRTDPKREPFDVILSRDEQHSALGSAFVDRTFKMRDVERQK